MVTAGVYLMTRVNPILRRVVRAGRPTSSPGSACSPRCSRPPIAVAQNDIKKVLAYSTVEPARLHVPGRRLGRLRGGHLPHGHPRLLQGAACSSAPARSSTGCTTSRTCAAWAPCAKLMPVTAGTFIVGWLAIAGVPPFAGFWSKDEILLFACDKSPVLWALGLVTALLTAFYMSRQVFMVFFGDEALDESPRTEHADAEVARAPVHHGARREPHESPWLDARPRSSVPGRPRRSSAAASTCPFTRRPAAPRAVARAGRPPTNERHRRRPPAPESACAAIAVAVGRRSASPLAFARLPQKRDARPVEPQLLADGWYVRRRPSAPSWAARARPASRASPRFDQQGHRRRRQRRRRPRAAAGGEPAARADRLRPQLRPRRRSAWSCCWRRLLPDPDRSDAPSTSSPPRPSDRVGRQLAAHRGDRCCRSWGRWSSAWCRQGRSSVAPPGGAGRSPPAPALTRRGCWSPSTRGDAGFQFEVASATWIADVGICVAPRRRRDLAVPRRADRACCSRWPSSAVDPQPRPEAVPAPGCSCSRPACIGVFLRLDLFVFFVLFEIVLVPMYFLIGGWGYADRVYAALKFFLFTMLGSAFMLVGIVGHGRARTASVGRHVTFDLAEIAEGAGVRRQHGGAGLFFAVRDRVRGEGAAVPGAHVAARRPHPGADGGFGDPGRRHAEARHLRARCASASTCSPRRRIVRGR